VSPWPRERPRTPENQGIGPGTTQGYLPRRTVPEPDDAADPKVRVLVASALRQELSDGSGPDAPKLEFGEGRAAVSRAGQEE